VPAARTNRCWRNARASRKTVSGFLLDAGVTAAAEALADRRRFVLDEAQWKAFQEALDRPVQSKQRLESLLRDPEDLRSPLRRE